MITTKLLARLILITSLTGLMACNGTEDREKKYLDRAQNYFQEKNYEKTRVELKNVLQINPKNIEATYLLSQIAEKEKNWRKMFGLLLQVTEANPDHLEAQLKIGTLLLLNNDSKQASEKAEYILAKQPDHVKATNLKATILLKNKELEQSEKLLQKSLTLDPGNLDASILLARIQRTNDDLDGALKSLDKTLATHPDALRASLEKIKIYAQQGKKQDVKQQYLALVQKNPKNQSLHYSLASLYISENKLDDSEKILRELINQLPEEDQPKNALIDFMLAQRSLEQAEQTLSTLIKQNPDNFSLRFQKLKVYKDQPEKIKTVLSNIIKDDPLGKNGLEAKNRLAALAIQEKNIPSAEKLLNEVIEEDAKNIVALLMRSGIYLQNKKADLAIADLRGVLRENPESEKALTMLAKAHLDKGNNGLVKENLEKIIALNPKNTAVAKDLARILSQNNEKDRALSVLKTTWNTGQKTKDLAVMLIDLHSQKEQWGQAEAYAEALMEMPDNKEVAHYKRAQLKQAQSDFKVATTEYKAVLQIKPLTFKAVKGLVAVLLAQKQVSEAEAVIDTALKQAPESIIFLNMRAKLHLQQNQLAPAEKILIKITQLKPQFEEGYKQLASFYLMQQKTEQAKQVYSQGLTKNPNSVTLLMTSALAHQMTKQLNQAIALYEKILTFQPKNALATNNLAIIMSSPDPDIRNLKKGLGLANKLKDIEEASFQDTYGWLNYLNGHYDKALVAIEKAISIEKNNPENHYHIAMVYLQKGRTEEAKQALEKATAEGANYVGIDQAKIELNKLITL